MKPSVAQLENLLALRREEHPGEDYWQDFLCEFHHRQRERAVLKSGPQALFGRISEWMSEMGPSKWAYGAGLAYATVTVAFFLMPRNSEMESAPARPVNYQVIPAPEPAVELLDQLDVDPSAQGRAGDAVYY